MYTTLYRHPCFFLLPCARVRAHACVCTWGAGQIRAKRGHFHEVIDRAMQARGLVSKGIPLSLDLAGRLGSAYRRGSIFAGRSYGSVYYSSGPGTRRLSSAGTRPATLASAADRAAPKDPL